MRTTDFDALMGRIGDQSAPLRQVSLRDLEGVALTEPQRLQAIAELTDPIGLGTIFDLHPHVREESASVLAGLLRSTDEGAKSRLIEELFRWSSGDDIDEAEAVIPLMMQLVLSDSEFAALLSDALHSHNRVMVQGCAAAMYGHEAVLDTMLEPLIEGLSDTTLRYPIAELLGSCPSHASVLIPILLDMLDDQVAIASIASAIERLGGTVPTQPVNSETDLSELKTGVACAVCIETSDAIELLSPERFLPILLAEGVESLRQNEEFFDSAPTVQAETLCALVPKCRSLSLRLDLLDAIQELLHNEGVENIWPILNSIEGLGALGTPLLQSVNFPAFIEPPSLRAKVERVTTILSESYIPERMGRDYDEDQPS